MVKEILKKLNSIGYAHGLYEVLRDAVLLWSICLSNQFDYRQSREDEYLRIQSKYSVAEMTIFAECFGMLVFEFRQGIDNKQFHDVLGELFMSSETFSKSLGQYFTPYSISRLVAKVMFSNCSIPKEILALNEPTSGSGGMILANLEELFVQGINYTSDVIVVANDIDVNCVHMTYLQLSLVGASAIILKGNTLTQEFSDVWRTPALCMQKHRFRQKIKDENVSKYLSF